MECSFVVTVRVTRNGNCRRQRRRFRSSAQVRIQYTLTLIFLLLYVNFRLLTDTLIAVLSLTSRGSAASG